MTPRSDPRRARTAAIAPILLLGGTLAVPPAAAQSIDAAPQADIVVTGRGLDAPDARSTPVAIIDRARLTQAASGRLEDVLADVAGLQSFRRADSRSANPTSQGITLRGIGGNASSRALLILDGVPQADPFAGWIAFPALAPSRLGQVRVQRGGGSGLWGPGALAGVIELTSATPDQLSPLSAEIFYGERNSVDAQASASLIRPGGFATLSVGYARGDGYAPIVPENRGRVDTLAPYEQANAAVRGVIGIAPDTELQANVQGFFDRRTRGLAFTDIESDGADASLRLVGRGRWGWSALAYVQTRRFASGFVSVNDARTVVTPTLDQYNVPATGLGGRIEVSPPLGEAIKLRLGGDVRQTAGVTKELFTYVAGLPTRLREAGGTTRTLGGFADLQATFGRLRIDASARLDGWWIEDGQLLERALAGGPLLTNLIYPDRSGSEATGRIGAALTLVDGVALRTAAYRGWRLPTPNELYRPFRVGADATGANPLLAPETLEGIEAGIDVATGPLTLGATVYANRLNGAVANVTIARGPGNFPGVGVVSAAGFYRRRENLDAIEAKGIELDARLRLGLATLAASYAYADARVEAGAIAPALNGLRPAQTPEHQASATAAMADDGWRAAATLRYASRQFEDDQNSRTLADALTLDLVAAAPLTRSLSVEARVENVTDARIETGFSGTALERARPRQWWIGLRTRFD
jgi:outer membrane receptor protein involved in Fe transport